MVVKAYMVAYIKANNEILKVLKESSVFLEKKRALAAMKAEQEINKENIYFLKKINIDIERQI